MGILVNMTTHTTTDRNGWPASLDTGTNTLTVQFPNGNVGTYETCHLCQGHGAVVASWGLAYHCHACACSGRRLVSVVLRGAALAEGGSVTAEAGR